VVFVAGRVGREVGEDEDEEGEEEGVAEIVRWLRERPLTNMDSCDVQERKCLQRGTRSLSAWGKEMRRSLRENMRWKGSTKNWIWYRPSAPPTHLPHGRKSRGPYEQVPGQEKGEANVVSSVGSLRAVKSAQHGPPGNVPSSDETTYLPEPLERPQDSAPGPSSRVRPRGRHGDQSPPSNSLEQGPEHWGGATLRALEVERVEGETNCLVQG
jgi:hypothetical protein